MIISKPLAPAIAMYRAVESRAGADPAFQGLVDEAVTRVLKAKAAQGLLPCAG